MSTCERGNGAQRNMMCGNSIVERLGLLEPVSEDWHCLVRLLQVAWKSLYNKSSADHGTLAFFRTRLNRIAVSKDPKKDVNATIDFLEAVVHGHWLACACEILETPTLDSPVTLPAELKKAKPSEQLKFVEGIAEKVVKRLTLVDSAFHADNQSQTLDTSSDMVYNYTRTLCHYGSLMIEFRDAWAEGDGERILRCWRLFLPHFRASGRTKYCLEALRLQLQVNVVLSPNLAHQVRWNRFVNTKGGLGMNIPCDLFNEHVNKQIKIIIQNMGPNLTEASLQRAVRCIAPLQDIAKQFDKESGVPITTSAHSTKSNVTDICKVVTVVLQQKMITTVSARAHKCFPNMPFNPLHNWDRKGTLKWIKDKKKECIKYQGGFRAEDSESLVHREKNYCLAAHTSQHKLGSRPDLAHSGAKCSSNHLRLHSVEFST